MPGVKVIPNGEGARFAVGGGMTPAGERLVGLQVAKRQATTNREYGLRHQAPDGAASSTISE